MAVKSDLVLYRYDLKITPDNSPKRKVQQVVKLLLRTLFDTPQMASVRGRVVSDFRSTLLSPERLDQDEFLTDIPITYCEEGEDEPKENAEIYRVRLLYTNTLQVQDLLDYVMSTGATAHYEFTESFMQAFNIFFNHFAKSNGNTTMLTMVGPQKTFAYGGPNLEHTPLLAGLIALRGYYTSARVATSRLLINVNVSAGAFFPSGSLVKLIEDFERENGPNKYRLEQHLKKLRIRTNHLPERKNKAGQVIIRAKNITGLAGKEDGRHLPHPPRVKQHGAGPADVEFYLENTSPKPGAAKLTSTGKKVKGSPPSEGRTLGGRYITVAEFFSLSKFILKLSSSSLTLSSV